MRESETRSQVLRDVESRERVQQLDKGTGLDSCSVQIEGLKRIPME